MRKLLYIGLIGLFFGCNKPKEESNIIPRQKFVSLLIRMHILDARITSQAMVDPFSGNAHYPEYDSLLKHYQVDSSILAGTFNYYHDKQQELEAIYKEVQDSLVVMAQKSVEIK